MKMDDFKWTAEDIRKARNDFSYNFIALDNIRNESYDIAIDCMTKCIELKENIISEEDS